MRIKLLLLLLLPIQILAQITQKPLLAYNLKDFSAYFYGSWENDTAKSEGMGMGTREYEFILNNVHLQVNNKANNLDKDGKTMICYHQDMGIFSYDKSRKKITYREFTSEKFFSQYVCDSISTDKKTFIFHSETFENIPSGYKGRITITIIDDNSFIEHFELAETGKSFQTYVKAKWVRKKETEKFELNLDQVTNSCIQNGLCADYMQVGLESAKSQSLVLRAWKKRNAKIFLDTASVWHSDVQNRMNMTIFIDYLIVNIQVDTVWKNNAIVYSHQQFSRVMKLPDGKERRRITTITHKEEWQKTEKGWAMLKFTEQNATAYWEDEQ